jgi:hypothetical protein
MSYKTIFIDTPTVKSKSAWGMSIQDANGDQLSRDVDAAILEKEHEGYELVQSMPIQSAMIYASSYPYSYTSGVLLIFKQRKHD